MKIHVEHGDFEEAEIVVRCKQIDDEILELLALLRERSSVISGFANKETHLVTPSDILYAESIDGKTFLYTVDMVLETHQSLTVLQAFHEDFGLLRISKSQIVNLHHVAKLKGLGNSRIEIVLRNGEKLIVSRHYIHSLKEKLGMDY